MTNLLRSIQEEGGGYLDKMQVLRTLQNSTILLIKAQNVICQNSLSVLCENIGNVPFGLRIIFRAIAGYSLYTPV